MISPPLKLHNGFRLAHSPQEPALEGEGGYREAFVSGTHRLAASGHCPDVAPARKQLSSNVGSPAVWGPTCNIPPELPEVLIFSMCPSAAATSVSPPPPRFLASDQRQFEKAE